MTQLTFSSNFYWHICFKFCILEQIITTVLFIRISSINNKRSLLRFQSTTATTNRGWSACGTWYMKIKIWVISIFEACIVCGLYVEKPQGIKNREDDRYRLISFVWMSCILLAHLVFELYLCIKFPTATRPHYLNYCNDFPIVHFRFNPLTVEGRFVRPKYRETSSRFCLNLLFCY